MDHINFCSSCCPTTTKKDLLATTANESSAVKEEANGSSTTTEKPEESLVQIRRIPHFKKKSELESFLKESKKKPNQLIVLNFTTTWCEPCKNAEKPLQKLVKEFNDVNFANVDVDHFLDLVNYLDVVKMPTFLLMKPDQSSNKGSKNVPKGNNEDASEGSGRKGVKYVYKGKKSQIDNFKEIEDREEGVRKDLEDLATKIGEHCHMID
ncbi:uncharacterized protein LOC131221868 isoform X2 [Magnolia sinica]|uniref:uncharacterized protein LOC131221868 isoform X2 n=1 Tax=Magnolia sinica TaxID=86752 RepID=UPI00265B456F|nr:uncharacterized protein LOC131221868 isoform X2 [Magnolia sinica]